MKKYIKTTIWILSLVLMSVRCASDFPVDEDGLLITARGQCYVSNFQLLGDDFQSVLTPGTSDNPNPAIDTTAQTIHAEVYFGTDLKNVFPQFTLVTDAKLEPKITGKVDMSDLAHPKQWTVISGNRKVRKTYTVTISIEE